MITCQVSRFHSENQSFDGALCLICNPRVLGSSHTGSSRFFMGVSLDETLKSKSLVVLVKPRKDMNNVSCCHDMTEILWKQPVTPFYQSRFWYLNNSLTVDTYMYVSHGFWNSNKIHISMKFACCRENKSILKHIFCYIVCSKLEDIYIVVLPKTRIELWETEVPTKYSKLAKKWGIFVPPRLLSMALLWTQPDSCGPQLGNVWFL